MRLGIIGGTLLPDMTAIQNYAEHSLMTPYGEPSAPIISGIWLGKPVAFIARHGKTHQIPPHRINYRANIWALKQLNVKQILAYAAVGGIREDMLPGQFVIPDQLIDYTHGRENSFFSEDFNLERHVDFTFPYNESLRLLLQQALTNIGLTAIGTATYAAVQGPRLETAAEIRRLQRDGCDIVGMTGMPEAVLARELDIDYACCALVVNWAAGIVTGEVDLAQITQLAQNSQEKLLQILQTFTLLLAKE